MKLLLQELGELFHLFLDWKLKNTVTDVVADVQKLDLKVNGYYCSH
jgi:hypothetical protein